MAQRTAPSKSTAEGQWTYERYLRETAEGEYFTIIGGEKLMSPSPTSFHQDILGNLYALLRAWVISTGLGKLKLSPFDVVLARDEVTQPDLIFVLTQHLDRLGEKNFQGAPDLVIEILSPGSVQLDRVKKRELYARHGVPEYWIVSPGERTVEIRRLQGEQYELVHVYEEGETLSSSLLTGFSCAVKDIFVE
jgi:Uma2 family endonuclease